MLFLTDFLFLTGRSLMLCVKQEGGLEHHSSPSGVTIHKLELFLCNEEGLLGRSRSKLCHWNYVAERVSVER